MAPPGLNVIALISGGKDSLFSILHCQANGHRVVALANLHPPRDPANENGDEGDDIDSYMYQTVGHSVIPLYEAALGIPLYRQAITGSAVDSSRDYGTRSPDEGNRQEQDETEDLVPLLKKVMAAHPDANAVSTGAILSTYQRTRVESVALRLGLTPLSYLWQYPLLPPYTQSSLLNDMAAVGQEAVIIKTASGGLDESFLGLNVADQKTVARVGKAMARFGEADNGAVLGEGGEFETLALGGPRGLWKRSIRLGVTQGETLDGGQAVLRMKGAEIVENEEEGGGLRVPDIWDEEFRRVLDSVDVKQDLEESTGESNTSRLSPCQPTTFPTNIFNDTPSVFTYTNLTASTQPELPTPASPSRQLTKLLLRLEHILTTHHLSRTSINHCTLLLRNMADFTVLNPVYAQYFDFTNPPARVTVAAGSTMPPGVDVMLSVVVDKLPRPDQRQGLHVQGRSYWAPANIGPYSQAVSVPLPTSKSPSTDSSPSTVVYIAGQIPLVPASMDVFTSHGFDGQALLSLQHLWRIGRTKGVRWWTAGVAFIPACNDAARKVATAQKVWKDAHAPWSQHGDDDGAEAEEDVDPWDRVNRHSGTTFNDTTHRAPIPDPGALQRAREAGRLAPPCFVVQVEALPRAVDVEWSATGVTSSSLISFSRASEDGTRGIATEVRDTRFSTFEVGVGEDLETVLRVDGARKWASATVYAAPGLRVGKRMEWRGVQWIPCQRVWGEDGREVSGVVVGRVDEETATL